MTVEFDGMATATQTKKAKAKAKAATAADTPAPAPAPAPKARKKKKQQADEASEPMDAMSRCATLCQEQKWREAAIVMRQVCDKAREKNNADLYVSLAGAQNKIEYSLRRQIAAALIQSAKLILTKEYLLDVGE